MIIAFAGGVGGARLAVGLAAVVASRQLTVVVNTGDDFEHLGLFVSPDIDTVMYSLAQLNNPSTGWGRAHETWNFMSAIESLGGETWFRLGDRDLAVHVLRSLALRRGSVLSEITCQLATRFGIRHSLIPMSDSPVRTRVKTDCGELSFQDYFVRHGCRPRVTGFRFVGSRNARVPEQLHGIMNSGQVEAVVFCPSNPYVSIAPILSAPAIRNWIRRRNFPTIAVSPIVGGIALKGPAAKMMSELGGEVNVLGVARHYGNIVDGWVIDKQDAQMEHAIRRLGRAVIVSNTVMNSRGRSACLARLILAFARTLVSQRS